jgi:hypothetical protein
VNFEVDNKIVVVIGDHSNVDGTFTVAYLDYLCPLATDRDFVLKSTETLAPFDLVLWIDFTARVLKQQLIENPVMGQVDKEFLKKADNLAAVILDGGFYEFQNNFNHRIGDYVPLYGDKIWFRRSNLIDSLNELSVTLDVEATMSRFLSLNIANEKEKINTTITINSIRDAQIVCEFNTEFARVVLV